MRIKRNQIINVFLMVYVLVSAVVIFFDLGQSTASINFVTWIAQFIPSIKPVADITSTPQSSALILALSWMAIPFVVITMLLIGNWNSTEFKRLYGQISVWLFLGVFVFGPVLVIFATRLVPECDSWRGCFLYNGLKNTEWFVIVYGAGIWLASSALIVCMIIFSRTYFLKIINKG